VSDPDRRPKQPRPARPAAGRKSLSGRTCRSMSLLTPSQKLLRARLIRYAARGGVLFTCAACAVRPALSPLYCLLFLLALQSPKLLMTALQSRGRDAKRALGTVLCVLGAVCLLVCAYLVAAAGSSGAPAPLPPDETSAVDAARLVSGAGELRAGPEAYWLEARRRAEWRRGAALHHLLEWLRWLARTVLAALSPLAATIAMRLCTGLLHRTEMPSFGLQSQAEYEEERERVTQSALSELGASIRRRGVPYGLSARARARLADVADGEGTGVTRAEALRWVRHAAVDDERTFEGCGFRIGDDGRRIDDDDDDGADSDEELDGPEPPAEEGVDSPLRAADYGGSRAAGGIEPGDDAATWANLLLVRRVATRVRDVTARRRALLPALQAVSEALEAMWALVLPGI